MVPEKRGRASRREDILPVSGLEARFRDQWIVIEVTEFTNNTWPVSGRLIARSRDQRLIFDAAKRFRAQNPEAQIAFLLRREEEMVLASEVFGSSKATG